MILFSLQITYYFGHLSQSMTGFNMAFRARRQTASTRLINSPPSLQRMILRSRSEDSPGRSGNSVVSGMVLLRKFKPPDALLVPANMTLVYIRN